MQKPDVIEELFKLSDIKGGLENARDVTKVVAGSFLQMVRELALPFRIAFSLGDDEKLKKTIDNYKKATEDYNSNTRRDLRALGAFEVDPDQLIYNPIGFFLTLPMNSYRFMMDDPGADDLPPFLEKTLRDMSGDTKELRKGLSALEKIFFESKNSVEILISEQKVPKGLTAKAVDELLSFFGIDAKSQRDKHFDTLIDMLEQGKASIEQRTKIIEMMKKVDNVETLKSLVKALNASGAKVDVGKIDKLIKDFQENSPESDDIKDLMISLVNSGVAELKSDIKKFLDRAPEEEDLKASEDSRAGQALNIINQIKSLESRI
ncbi:MAG: hypothetical protein CMA72_06995 [Euryarchaeota archaeon]|nr:hypothetical protein [Euryarchaeota archaeon]|tara:strand:+ start:27213 stop:28172 length:960 start_codon:yes stop_codon:yes gene_type:complete